MSNELQPPVAAKTVDARGMACHGPLLEAKKSIGGVATFIGDASQSKSTLFI